MTRCTPIVLLLGGLLGLVPGCERQGLNTRALPLEDLPAAGSTVSGGWQSAPLPTGAQCERDTGEAAVEWQRFEGRETLELVHGLGRVPSLILPYIAFESRGCGGTLASGDAARIEGVDGTTVRIQNGTTEEFFLRLYLQ